MINIFFKFSLIAILQLGFYFSANFKSVASSVLSTDLYSISGHEADNPVLSPQDIIFQVKHSQSPNVVVYQANKTLQKILNPEKPIDVYWLMNTKGKKLETLTTIEWRMAFGYRLLPIVKGKKYKIQLNAIKNKEITILQDDLGKVEAFMTINGVYAKLNGVFIDFEYSFYLPQVNYVEFTGTAITTNKKCTERIVS
jgi:hypothetical protein